MPGPGAHVVIPQTRRIVLDVNPPPLGSITVHGVLAFADMDIDLTVGWIMVHGQFEIGTEARPYPYHATITLNGPLDQDVMGMGARFIGAMNGGALEIHGSRRADVDWAVLNAHAKPGDTTISLELVEQAKLLDQGTPRTELGWRSGDLLAIAPSGRDPLQAEAVTITAVAGTQVSFTPPLRFHHWGELQPIAERVVDERAEVGLLTRNIVIQGAADGFARQMGGHIMIMAGSIGKIEGAELRRMGQMGRKGRYPIHWHLTGHGPTDYARFTSIWSSFHRAVAVHQTHGVEVRGNVAADIWSHAFVVAEDGNEIGNIVEDNLGILTKRLPESKFAFARASDPASNGPAAQDEWRPATFWINNPDNIVRRNRAAGGLDANGFYFDDDHGRFWTQSLFHGDVAGNVAHSYLTSTVDTTPDPHTVSGVGLLVRMAPRVGLRSIASFTGYHNSVAGAWLENSSDVLQDPVLADNATGAIVFRSRVDDALIVGQTNNRITMHPPETIRGGIRVIGRLGGIKAPQVSRTTFVAQLPAAVYVESDHLAPGNRFEANTLTTDTPVPVFLRDRTVDHLWSGGLLDLDGSLTRAGEPTVVTGQRLSDASVFKPGWGTFESGGAFTTPQTSTAGPTGLTAHVDGATVSLAWYPPADPSLVNHYLLEAGSGPGRADLVQANVGLTTMQVIPGVPAGQYFVRVRGDATQASNEVRVVVGRASCDVPDPPTPLTFGVHERSVTLTWTPSPGATGYTLVAGSIPGGQDVLVLPVSGGTTTVGAVAPPGTYHVRVAARNACGASAFSNEVTVVVQ